MSRGKAAYNVGQVAVTHGTYRNLTSLDRRTKLSKALEHIQAQLSFALGNDITPQQALLIQRASFKAIRCALAEAEIIRNGENISPELERNYLRYSGSLRDDLRLLGLERKQKQIQDLTAYVQK